MSDQSTDPDLLETVLRCRLCKVVCEYEEDWFTHCDTEDHRKLLEQKQEEDLQRRIEEERLKIVKRLEETEKHKKVRELFNQKHSRPQLPKRLNPSQPVKAFPFKHAVHVQPQNQPMHVKRFASKPNTFSPRGGPKAVNRPHPMDHSPAYVGSPGGAQQQDAQYPERNQLPLQAYDKPSNHQGLFIQATTSSSFNQASTSTSFNQPSYDQSFDQPQITTPETFFNQRSTSPSFNQPSTSHTSAQSLFTQATPSTSFNRASTRDQPPFKQAPTGRKAPQTSSFNQPTRFSFSTSDSKHQYSESSQSNIPARAPSASAQDSVLSREGMAVADASVFTVSNRTPTHNSLPTIPPQTATIFAARNMSPLTINTESNRSQPAMSAFRFSVEESVFRGGNDTNEMSDAQAARAAIEEEIQENLYLLEDEPLEQQVEQVEGAESSFRFRIPDHMLPEEGAVNFSVQYDEGVKVEPEDHGVPPEDEDQPYYIPNGEDVFDIHPECSSEDEEYLREPVPTGGQSAAANSRVGLFRANSESRQLRDGFRRNNFNRNLLRLERPPFVKPVFSGRPH